MGTYFFDTSALKHRYVNTLTSPRVKAAVSDHRNSVYISELTIVELASAFADDCIQRAVGGVEYDRMYRVFFRDLADRRVQVRSVSHRNFDGARHLLRYARVIRGRHLTSADAIIAESCRQLAYELKMRVTFYLCDQRLHNTLSSISAYTSAVRLRLL